MARGNFKLTDLLRSRGYRLNFILSGTHTFWYDLRQHYGNGIDFYFDGSMSRRHLPTDDRLIFVALEQVADFDGKPAFFYFHLVSAHNLGVKQQAYSRFRPFGKAAHSGALPRGGAPTTRFGPGCGRA